MVEDGRVYWCRNSIEFSCVKQSCWAATLDWRVPHYGYISSQVKLNFLVENSNSKYHQIVDGFPGVPKGSCLESATFWAAVQEWRKPALQYKNLFRNAMLSLIDYISQEPWRLILGAQRPMSSCPFESQAFDLLKSDMTSSFRVLAVPSTSALTVRTASSCALLLAPLTPYKFPSGTQLPVCGYKSSQSWMQGLTFLLWFATFLFGICYSFVTRAAILLERLLASFVSTLQGKYWVGGFRNFKKEAFLRNQTVRRTFHCPSYP